MASIHQRPNGSWQVHYRDDQRRQRTRTFRAKEHARGFASDVEAAKARAVKPTGVAAWDRSISIRANAQIPKEDDDRLLLAADTFKLLGDTTRLRILSALLEGERSVSELAGDADAPVPGVSQHLAKLRSGGLVKVRRQGTRMLYRVVDPRIAQFLALISGLSHRLVSPGTG